MHGFVIRWLVVTLSILLVSYLMDGIEVSGFLPALAAAALLGFLNAFLRPLLFLLTLPLTLLTFGIFIVVINAILLLMVSGLIPGFAVAGFWSALWGSVLIGVISWILNSTLFEQGHVTFVEFSHRRRHR